MVIWGQYLYLLFLWRYRLNFCKGRFSPVINVYPVITINAVRYLNICRLIKSDYNGAPVLNNNLGVV